MTSATQDNDQRRKKLLTQLAAILQVDGGLEEERAGAPSGAQETTPSDLSPTAELRELGLLATDDSGPAPRIEQLANGPGGLPAMPGHPILRVADVRRDEFVPAVPGEFSALRLAEAEVESLILKFMLHRQSPTGRELTQQVGIPFGICEKLLHTLKSDRLVVLKAAASLGDYVYELTEFGIQRARKFAEHCGYFGAAPVCLEDYAASVAAQSLQNGHPQIDDLRRAFADMTLSEATFERLGRAIISGKGLFLHGPPGNGKTSIAQRVTRAYGESIWIPRAISVWGEIIRVFDPSCHVELPLGQGAGSREQGAGSRDSDSLLPAPCSELYDRRWVRIRRPTIVVGSELLLDNLEITPNPATGIAEAPLQLKSNCGTLVIDDFGRQQMAPANLLNRWIVPLEKRYDFLNLTSGRKIRVPFDQFIVFSTNLEPRELVDEAFLRRIPYKIDICGPTEEQFRALFGQLALVMGIEPGAPSGSPAVDYLIDRYYRQTGRAMRFCHPRDLLRQVKVFYEVMEEPAQLSVEAIDAAATDYFSVL